MGHPHSLRRDFPAARRDVAPAPAPATATAHAEPESLPLVEAELVHDDDRGVRFAREFPNEPPQTIALACSDGRYSLDDTDILAQLGIRQYPDRVSIPGGAGGLHLLSSLTHAHRTVHLEEIAFLVEHHRTKRLYLIAHAHCGHYERKYPRISDADRTKRQRADLLAVAAELRRLHPSVEEIVAWYASVEDGHVVMRRITSA